MRFWSWLFPSDEDRIAKARMLISERRYADARTVLRYVNSAEAEELYRTATRKLRGDEHGSRKSDHTSTPLAELPFVFRALQPDGSQEVHAGHEAIVINAPQAEHEMPFSEDPFEIACAVVQHFEAKELGWRDFTFVEALWLLAKSDVVQAPSNPERAALETFVRASAQGDVDRVVESLRSLPPGQALTYVDAIAAWRFPREVSTELLARKAPELGIHLASTLASSDPEQLLRLIDLEADPERIRLFTFEGLVASIDAGQPNQQLSDRWEAVRHGGTREEQLEYEVCLWARTDLERAGQAWNTLLDEIGNNELATEAYLTRLAAKEPERALAMAVREERCGTDDLPRVLACHRGGVDVSAVLDDYIESLHAYAYRPFDHFTILLELCLRTRDKDQVRRTLERAGASGWQTTIGAREGIRALAKTGSPELETMLTLCSSLYTPGIVAGRDASDGGIHAGNVVYRPEWLAFSIPRPVETLRVIAALGDDGPRWSRD